MAREKDEELKPARGLLSGIEIIERERDRQFYEEGWGDEHDDRHTRGEMAVAAACYAIAAVPNRGLTGSNGYQVLRETAGPMIDAWPWAKMWDKREKHDRIHCLQIAGALIAAELDRLQRMAKQNEDDDADEKIEQWNNEHPEVGEVVGTLARALAGGEKKSLREAASFAVEKLRPISPIRNF